MLRPRDFLPLVLLLLGSGTLAQSTDAVSSISPRPNGFDASGEFRPQLHGVAKPKMSATLRSLVAGTIAEIRIKEGQVVQAGDPLITLDDRLVQAQLRIAEIEAAKTGDLNRAVTQLNLAERQLSRMEGAFERNAISSFEFEEHRSRVEQARAVHLGQLETRELADANRVLAVEQLRRLTVHAPFAGIVTQLHAKPGESVDPTTPVVSIANLETLEIEMHTPMDLYGTIRPGGKVQVLAHAPVNDTLSAEVNFASPIVNSASGTFRCILHIDNSERRLPAGFSVTLGSEAKLTPVQFQQRLHDARQ